MTLGFGHLLGVMTADPTGVSRELSRLAPHPGSVQQFLPGPMAVIAAYLATLLVLVVLGVLGWQRPGKGGGNGGGGTHGPAKLPTPPGGGLQLVAESPELTAARDLAAWEAELRAPDNDQALPRRADSPASIG
jgi:hypothetical protein